MNFSLQIKIFKINLPQPSKVLTDPSDKIAKIILIFARLIASRRIFCFLKFKFNHFVQQIEFVQIMLMWHTWKFPYSTLSLGYAEPFINFYRRHETFGIIYPHLCP